MHMLIDLEDNLRLQVWEKARTLDDLDPSKFRKDPCGAIIAWSNFNMINSQYGWGVDLIFPESLGGTLIVDNMRPMQLKNLEAKGNSYPAYKGVVTRDAITNRHLEKEYVVNSRLREKIENLYPQAKSYHD